MAVHRQVGRLTLLVALLVLAVPGPRPEPPWAFEAEVWAQAWTAAQQAGHDRRAAFLAPEARLTHDGHPGQAVGRSAVVRALRQLGTPVDDARGALYLDRSGLVLPQTLPDEDADALPTLVALELGEEGVAARSHASITSVGRGSETARRTAQAYAAAWSTGDPSVVADLYTSGARLADSLRGLDVVGPHAIAALGSGEALLVEAVYRIRSDDASRQGVWVLVRSSRPCPGRLAVRLLVDSDDRVVTERRYHRLESWRGCGDSSPDGWWTARQPPRLLSRQVTGTVPSAAGPIEIRNGGRRSEALLRWALGQLERAGLPPAPVTAVTFDPYHPTCAGVLGRSRFTGATTSILLCLDEQSMCADGSCLPTAAESRLVLHEIGHAWLRAHADAGARTAFERAVGTAGWDDEQVPWVERGVEWAADTLAWGLLETRLDLALLGHPDCGLLRAGFRLLTGRGALTTCPA